MSKRGFKVFEERRLLFTHTAAPIATTLTAHSSAISAQRIAVRVIVKAEISNNKT